MIETFSNQQHNFLMSDAKFTGFVGGYKAGKTFVFIRRCFKALIDTGQTGLIAEPNYRMNVDILQPALESFFRDFQKSNPKFKWVWKGGDSLYQTSYGTIILRTLNKRSSLEGHNIGWFGFDEIDLLKLDEAQRAWNTIISKLTLGKKQFGFVVGTNEGFSFIYEKFYKNADKIKERVYQKDGMQLFISSTYENQDNLPDGYIDTLLQTYDEQLVKRYINGEFINLQSGQVYYNFDRDAYLTDIEFNRELPIKMCWDFNATSKPMATALVQYDIDIGKYIVVKEFVNKHTNTEQQCKIILDWLTDEQFNLHGQKVEIYGDSAGKRMESSANKSDYQIIRNYFERNPAYYKDRRNHANPRIKDRVNALNSMFKNAKSENKLLINKECINLIEDCERVAWQADTFKLDDANENLTHISDAVSYWANKDYPTTRRPIRYS